MKVKVSSSMLDPSTSVRSTCWAPREGLLKNIKALEFIRQEVVENTVFLLVLLLLGGNIPKNALAKRKKTYR